MKIVMDITQTQVRALEDLAKAENRSCAAVITAAIDDYIKLHRRGESNEASFGLWRKDGMDGMDGLQYQR